MKLYGDNKPMVASQPGLRAIPTVYLFQNGQLVDDFHEPQQEETIRALRQKVLITLNRSDEAEAAPLQGQDSCYQGRMVPIDLLKQAADTPEIQQLQQQPENEPDHTALASKLASELLQISGNVRSAGAALLPSEQGLERGGGPGV